jgi:hypothetical protein
LRPETSFPAANEALRGTGGNMKDAPGPSGPSGESEIRVHPLVAKVIEAIEGDEGVVERRGFIGPAREGDDTAPLCTTSIDVNEGKRTERVRVHCGARDQAMKGGTP